MVKSVGLKSAEWKFLYSFPETSPKPILPVGGHRTNSEPHQVKGSKLAAAHSQLSSAQRTKSKRFRVMVVGWRRVTLADVARLGKARSNQARRDMNRLSVWREAKKQQHQHLQPPRKGKKTRTETAWAVNAWLEQIFFVFTICLTRLCYFASWVSFCGRRCCCCCCSVRIVVCWLFSARLIAQEWFYGMLVARLSRSFLCANRGETSTTLSVVSVAVAAAIKQQKNRYNAAMTAHLLACQEMFSSSRE